MRRFLPLIFLSLLVSSSVYAQIEIPTDGIDNDGAGGDALVSGPDADFDGYLDATQDCDATNKRIQSGAWVRTGCSGNQAKLCTGSTYGSCTTPVISGKTNYYVDCTAGNDANAGTFASPWASFTNVNAYQSGSEPPTWVGMAPDTVVWLLAGTCTGTYTYATGQKAHVYFRQIAASAGNEWEVRSPQGSGAVMAPAGCNITTGCAVFTAETSDYGIVDGIEMTNGYGKGDILEGSGIATDADFLTIVRNNIHDNSGSAGQNTAGINGSISPIGWDIANNIIIDNFNPAAGSPENERQWVLFTPQSTRIHHNIIGLTAPYTDPDDSAQCGVIKHGAATGSNEIDHNIHYNCSGVGAGSGGAGTLIHHNLFLDVQRSVQLQDFGGVTCIKDEQIYNNTTANTGNDGFYEINPVSTGACTGVGAVDGYDNVYLSADASIGNEDATLTLFTYGTAPERTAFMGAGHLDWDGNCYFPAVSPKFCDWCGGVGTLYTFANWILQGFDTTSFYENPTYNGSYEATSTNCATKGYNLASGTTTTTTSTTTTTTLLSQGQFSFHLMDGAP